MREDLIKILAGLGDDPAKTYEKLEEYIRKKMDDEFEKGAKYGYMNRPINNQQQ